MTLGLDDLVTPWPDGAQQATNMAPRELGHDVVGSHQVTKSKRKLRCRNPAPSAWLVGAAVALGWYPHSPTGQASWEPHSTAAQRAKIWSSLKARLVTWKSSRAPTKGVRCWPRNGEPIPALTPLKSKALRKADRSTRGRHLRQQLPGNAPFCNRRLQRLPTLASVPWFTTLVVRGERTPPPRRGSGWGVCFRGAVSHARMAHWLGLVSGERVVS